MNKLKILALSIGLLSAGITSAYADNQDNGTLQIKGKIIAGACTIANGVSQDVTLPTMDDAAFIQSKSVKGTGDAINNGITEGLTGFQIEVTCVTTPPSGVKGVKDDTTPQVGIQFTNRSVIDQNNVQLLPNTYQGTPTDPAATGVGLRLFDSNAANDGTYKPLDISNTDKTKISYLDQAADMTFNYGAAYEEEVAGTRPGDGGVLGVANFAIVYQ